jgi:hypothetical protein
MILKALSDISILHSRGSCAKIVDALNKALMDLFVLTETRYILLQQQEGYLRDHQVTRNDGNTLKK